MCDLCRAAEVAANLPETRRTRFTDCRIHDKCDCDPWTYCYLGPWWPGNTSDEWIEYIPEPCLVERDGELWWRHDDGDAVHWTQITKAQDGERHE